MHSTILVKLIVKDEDKIRLQSTFSDYKKAWQYVSDWVFVNKIKNRTNVHHATYKNVRNLVPNLNSCLVQEARNDAISKAKIIKSNQHKITESPKLKNISMRYHKGTASLKGNILSFSANGGKRIKVELVNFPRLQANRTYKTLSPVLFNRNGQYWVALTFDLPEKSVGNGPILGVDMGLRIMAAISDGRLIRGTKMNRLRRKIQFTKKALQRKGTKSAKRHLRRIRRKEQRQSRDVTHCAVNEILRTDASIIAIEDLDLRARKFRKGSNRRRFSVPLSEFRRILEYKGKLCGKQVVAVKPNFTSQDDFRGLERGVRTGGKYVGSDGRQFHADINAASNIAIRAQKTLSINNPCSLWLTRQATVNLPNVSCS